MKILITNDDGIDAPGIQALWDCASTLLADHSPEIFVVAPDRGRSECSHSVTSGPLKLNCVRPNWYSLNGTPVDCVRVAMTTLVPDPVMVFSGINAGANLGVNLMVSGTYAAARETVVHGVPAMAISHYRRPDIPKTWDHAVRWLGPTMQQFAATAQSYTDKYGAGIKEHIPSNQPAPLWNVNLPAIDPLSEPPPVVECEVDRCPIERCASREGDIVSFELDFHGRPRSEGTDVDRCFAGCLTISKLSAHNLGD